MFLTLSENETALQTTLTPTTIDNITFTSPMHKNVDAKTMAGHLKMHKLNGKFNGNCLFFSHFICIC